MKRFGLLLGALLCMGATDHGTIELPKCPENPCKTYRFIPFCTDADRDDVCDGYTFKTWTKSSAITSVPAVCNPGSNANADPDVNPVFSFAGCPAGLTCSTSTGAVSGTPSAEGSGQIVVTCANDLGSRQDVLSYTINESPSTAGATYYVDSAGGNNNNTGLSHAQRWQTLAKVNTDVTAAGADVFLLQDSDFSGQTLTVDWDGTAVDPSTVGTYYGTGTIGYQTTRATVSGTYDSSCSVTLGGSGACAMSTGAAVPTNQFLPLIQVSADYVTLQDLIITESAGTGVNITDNHHLTIDNVKFHITASLAVFPKNSQFLVVRDSEFSYTAIASSRGDNLYGGGPHAMSIQNSNPSYALVENNYFHELFGEAVNCRTSSFCVIRGNRIANVKNIGIYIDNQSDTIVENNEIYGTTFNAPASTPGPAWDSGSTGIYVAVEGTSAARKHTIRNVVRNNLIANVNNCIVINVFPEVEAEGWQTGGQIIGNTCLAYTSQAFNTADPTANNAGWEIANNIFDQPNNGGSSVCSAPATAQLDFHHNAWAAAPGDADCRGTGDVAGASGVSTSEDWTLAGQGHLPSASDWELSGTASADEVGDPMTAAMYSTAAQYLQFSLFDGVQQAGETCDPADTNWQKELALDISCNVRHASTPDIGAKED